MYDNVNLKKLPTLKKLAPEAMAGFEHLFNASMAPGAIPKKYKELIALAVGLTTQCPYCLETHRAAAKHAGASDVELAETVFIAATLRAGAALTHGTHIVPPDLS